MDAHSSRQDEEPVLVLDFVTYDRPAQGTLTIDECQKLIWGRVVDFRVLKARVGAMVEEARCINSHWFGEISAERNDHDHSDWKIKLAVGHGIFFHDVKHATAFLLLQAKGVASVYPVQRNRMFHISSLSYSSKRE
jgi:hypothetical protein